MQHSTHLLGKQGLVFKIDPSFQYLRGSRAHQTPIWPPPTLVDIPQGSTDLTTSRLVLQVVEQNPRNVIMDLGVAWIQKRKMCITIAFDFGSHILAFITIDHLCQVYWEASRAALPAQHLDPLVNFDYWLQTVIDWSQNIPFITGHKAPLAVKCIQELNSPFAGVGTYTANELFFLAGLCLFLMVLEVFYNPSRIACLCAGYMQIVYTTPSRILEIIKPSRRRDEYLISATIREQHSFQRYLHVFGRDKCYISARQKRLVEEAQFIIDYHQEHTWGTDGGYSWIRNPTPEWASYYPSGREYEFKDYFEPGFVREALDAHGAVLGGPIFSENKWSALGGCQVHTSPLSQAFLESSPTFLNLNIYETIYIPSGLRAKHVPTYHFNLGFNAWSILTSFGSSSASRIEKQNADGSINTVFLAPHQYPSSEFVRQSKLLRTIIAGS
ncbi:hypothetical protein M422DRAFT_251518 [Sphaerobolus stellatus SS14]|uniref:Uncharacterized protein n=1 Tax=Sphaerobolus stellatus (strain SS14) TaxID=990650 RepID=A0A0C9W0H1_SPHS4|nr:hypothetical protein M422DRAFT_251518 [Sphaerobolus stellatus SS14]